MITPSLQKSYLLSPNKTSLQVLNSVSDHITKASVKAQLINGMWGLKSIADSVLVRGVGI